MTLLANMSAPPPPPHPHALSCPRERTIRLNLAECCLPRQQFDVRMHDSVVRLENEARCMRVTVVSRASTGTLGNRSDYTGIQVPVVRLTK